MVVTPAQKQIGGAAVPVASPQMGVVIIRHHQAIPFRGTQESTDPVIEIAPAPTVQILDQVSQSFIEPTLFIAVSSFGEINRENMFAEDNGVRVFMGGERAKVWTGMEARIEIHHIAMIAEWRRQIPIQVTAPDKPVQGFPPAGHSVQTRREQDGESPVTVYIDDIAEPGPGFCNNVPVKYADHIVNSRLETSQVGMITVHVHLTGLADCPEQSCYSTVIRRILQISSSRADEKVSLERWLD
jgi:hypothetical protein